MVDSRDHALQVKWLWAMAAWYDNLQMTLTGLVGLLLPPVLPKMPCPQLHVSCTSAAVVQAPAAALKHSVQDHCGNSLVGARRWRAM